MTIMSPFTIEWHPVLRSLVLTLIFVPLAVYLVVPRLLALHHRLRSRDVPLTVFPGPRADGWSAGKGLEPSEAKVSNHLTPVRGGTS